MVFPFPSLLNTFSPLFVAFNERGGFYIPHLMLRYLELLDEKQIKQNVPKGELVGPMRHH